MCQSNAYVDIYCVLIYILLCIHTLVYTYSCIHPSCIYIGWFYSNEHTFILSFILCLSWYQIPADLRRVFVSSPTSFVLQELHSVQSLLAPRIALSHQNLVPSSLVSSQTSFVLPEPYSVQSFSDEICSLSRTHPRASSALTSPSSRSFSQAIKLDLRSAFLVTQALTSSKPQLMYFLFHLESSR